MGYWGVRSYEDDDADNAIDAGFEQVHGQAYEDLMDDECPLTHEQVLRKLANPQTLAAALQALENDLGHPPAEWEDEEKISYCGIVVRHAEFEVPLPPEVRDQALQWLESEDVLWNEEDVEPRAKRRRQEIALLTRQA